VIDDEFETEEDDYEVPVMKDFYWVVSSGTHYNDSTTYNKHVDLPSMSTLQRERDDLKNYLRLRIHNDPGWNMPRLDRFIHFLAGLNYHVALIRNRQTELIGMA
jgi:hypothetical protein